MDLKSIDPTILATLIAVASSGVGAITVAFFGVMRDRSNRMSEERRIIYDIASKLALDQWKLDVERTDALNETLKNGGVFQDRSSLLDFQVPIPHVAQTVRRIVDELNRSSSPKPKWQRFKTWRAACKKNKKA